MTSRLRRYSGNLAEFAGRAVASLPGFAAVGCAVAGSFLLWGVGVALLVAAGFLLLIDRRMP